MQKTHWPSTGSYKQIVDIESSAKEKFSKITRWPDGEELSIFVSATLKEEPKNKYGTTPISVSIDDSKIGALSRYYIDDYHGAVAKSGVQGKETKAHARITRIFNSKGEEKFSLGVDISFHLPPGTLVDRKLKFSTDNQVPYFHSITTIRNGYLILIREGVDPETVNKCTPGRDVDCWSPDGSDDIYLYAEGSVGGSGKIAITDMENLARAGFSTADDFRPVIHSASGDIVIVSAKLPPRS